MISPLRVDCSEFVETGKEPGKAAEQMIASFGICALTVRTRLPHSALGCPCYAPIAASRAEARTGIMGPARLDDNACKVGDAVPVAIKVLGSAGEILVSNPNIAKPKARVTFHIRPGGPVIHPRTVRETAPASSVRRAWPER